VPDPRHVLGLRGELATARWLSGHGWRLLARRWRCPSGELDLVLRDPDGVLVGVEVKVRHTTRAGGAAESVDARRVARLRSALVDYASATGAARGAAGLRVDLVTLAPAGEGRWRLSRLPAIDAW
jgi:putative endonuclease